MSGDDNPQAQEALARRNEAEEALFREILNNRKFTVEEAIGRMAGRGGMKGQSPVARLQQAQIELENWLGTHAADAGGALKVVLHRHVASSDLLLNNYEQPLVVLADYCQRVLDSEFLLEALVRDLDVEWGRIVGEKPFFESKGSAPHPEDPYTVESVRKSLSAILLQLAAS